MAHLQKRHTHRLIPTPTLASTQPICSVLYSTGVKSPTPASLRSWSLLTLTCLRVGVAGRWLMRGLANMH